MRHEYVWWPVPSFSRSLVATLVSSTLVLSACGGSGGASSGGGTDVPGLDMPTKVSVVAAQGDSASSDASGTSGSAFATDVARTHVSDPSMDALDTVNSILCYVSQAGASNRVNAGPYIALVDEASCERNSGGGSSAGGQSEGGDSGSNAPSYAQWIVDVKRANANAAQHVKIWVPADNDSGSDPMDAQQILAELTVTEAPSEANPNGQFVLNFAGVVDGALMSLPGTEVSMMRGTLKTVPNSGQGTQLSYFNEMGSEISTVAALGVTFGSLEQANVLTSGAGTQTGRALTSTSFSDGGSSGRRAFAVDYNAVGMQRGLDANDDGVLQGSEVSCLSRDTFDTYTWRYNLYHSDTGARVNLNTGFPFNAVNGQSQLGYVGYWGVWTENRESLSNGDVITRETRRGGTGEQYTVALSEGKLSKRSRETVPFADVVGAEMSWWGDSSDPFCGSGCANTQQHMVSVNAAGAVNVTHTWDNSGSEPVLNELGSPVLLTQTNVDDTLHLWSDALGGSVRYQQGASSLTVFGESALAPNDASLASGLSLVCYSGCPVGGVHAPSNSSGLYYADGRQTYTLSAANGAYSLLDDTAGQVVALRDTSALSSGQGQENVFSGPMVLASDDPGSSNAWQIYDMDTTYHWQSGAREWNRTTALLDGDGAVVQFDQPLQFFYRYSAGDDPNVNAALTEHPAGNRYRLSYGGPGDLWGFPYEASADCAGDDHCPWYPTITLADGVTLGAGDQYKVRQIESEQRMRDSGSACTGLDAANVLADSSFGLPSAIDAAVSFRLSDKPDLSGEAPAVIGGVEQ